VLPDRIELSTSPLPMECSTTELRQRAPDTRIGQKGPSKARRSLPQGRRVRKRGQRPARPIKAVIISAGRPLGPSIGSLWVDPVPHVLAPRGQRLDRADHDLEFEHFAGFIEFDEIEALALPFADIGGKFQRDVVGAS
jgi:hypothetical protein